MDLEWISPRVPVPLLLCYFSCNEQGHTDSKRTESPYLDKPRADGLGAMLLQHATARKQLVRESGLPEKMRRPGQLSPQGNINALYDAVIRPGNLSNAGLILPTCRLFRLSFMRLISVIS